MRKLLNRSEDSLRFRQTWAGPSRSADGATTHSTEVKKGEDEEKATDPSTSPSCVVNRRDKCPINFGFECSGSGAGRSEEREDKGSSVLLEQARS